MFESPALEVSYWLSVARGGRDGGGSTHIDPAAHPRTGHYHTPKELVILIFDREN